MWAALAEAAGARPAGVVRHDRLAAAALPLRLPKPLLAPLAVERRYLDNYLSIAKARHDLGYQPLFTTKQAMEQCTPYYVDLFHRMKSESAEPILHAAVPAPPKG